MALNLNLYQRTEFKISDTYKIMLKWSAGDPDYIELPMCTSFKIPTPKFTEETLFFGNNSKVMMIPDYNSPDDVELEFYEDSNDRIITKLIGQMLAYNFNFHKDVWAYIAKNIYELRIDILSNDFKEIVYSYVFKYLKITNFDHYSLDYAEDSPIKYKISLAYMYFSQDASYATAANMKSPLDYPDLPTDAASVPPIPPAPDNQIPGLSGSDPMDAVLTGNSRKEYYEYINKLKQKDSKFDPSKDAFIYYDMASNTKYAIKDGKIVRQYTAYTSATDSAAANGEAPEGAFKLENVNPGNGPQYSKHAAKKKATEDAIRAAGFDPNVLEKEVADGKYKSMYEAMKAHGINTNIEYKYMENGQEVSKKMSASDFSYASYSKYSNNLIDEGNNNGYRETRDSGINSHVNHKENDKKVKEYEAKKAAGTNTPEDDLAIRQYLSQSKATQGCSVMSSEDIAWEKQFAEENGGSVYEIKGNGTSNSNRQNDANHPEPPPIGYSVPKDDAGVPDVPPTDLDPPPPQPENKEERVIDPNRKPLGEPQPAPAPADATNNTNEPATEEKPYEPTKTPSFGANNNSISNEAKAADLDKGADNPMMSLDDPPPVSPNPSQDKPQPPVQQCSDESANTNNKETTEESAPKPSPAAAPAPVPVPASGSNNSKPVDEKQNTNTGNKPSEPEAQKAVDHSQELKELANMPDSLDDDTPAEKPKQEEKKSEAPKKAENTPSDQEVRRDELAYQMYRGNLGNGDPRKKSAKEAGYSDEEIKDAQNEVNKKQWNELKEKHDQRAKDGTLDAVYNKKDEAPAPAPVQSVEQPKQTEDQKEAANKEKADKVNNSLKNDINKMDLADIQPNDSKPADKPKPPAPQPVKQTEPPKTAPNFGANNGKNVETKKPVEEKTTPPQPVNSTTPPVANDEDYSKRVKAYNEGRDKAVADKLASINKAYGVENENDAYHKLSGAKLDNYLSETKYAEADAKVNYGIAHGNEYDALKNYKSNK